MYGADWAATWTGGLFDAAREEHPADRQVPTQNAVMKNRRLSGLETATRIAIPAPSV